MPTPPPEPSLVLWLLREADRHGTVVAVVRSAGRLERLAALATALATGVQVVVLPSWDVLPYDSAPPSAGSIGRRVRALSELAHPAHGPRLLLTSADAALQRVRPRSAWTNAALVLRRGDPLDMDALRIALAERGYRWDERVDEPGDVALRGQVIDVFPAGEPLPVRLDIAEGAIASLRRFDPVTLRSTDPVDSVSLHPAIEFPLDPEDLDEALEALEAPASDDDDDDAVPEPAADRLAPIPDRLVPVFDFVPGAPCYRDAEVAERWAAAQQAIADAYAASARASRAAGATTALPRPAKLYLTARQAGAALGRALEADAAGEQLPPPRRIDELIELARAAPAGMEVVIATPADPGRVAASLAKRGLDARTEPGGTARVLQLDTAACVRCDGLLLLPIGALLRPQASTALALADDPPRIGETVVHADHGVCRLSGLRDVDAEERVALEFADGAELLVAADELDRIWRYGGDGVVSLDRIGGEAWHKKRGEIEAEIADAAKSLAAAAAARAETSAPKIVPPQPGYAQVERRFPFPPSLDQRAAIHAVLEDLASGRPMDRLLCGDVGFGKTEVAIRAAAAAALAGWQVAVAAPTTVLARQHLDVFRRRFAGTGVRVEGLIRGTAAEARAVRAAIASGEAGIVVGTQGLAQLCFKRLGLAVIDEEQRFGEGDKAKLAKLAHHVLVMTATPIPRTMQSALVGLREVSVLATPPQHRQPTRTFVLQWEADVVREALLRERRRGGQSFVVCPRIAGVAAMQARLAELVPELDVVAAHGRMKPEVLEAAVLGFASGKGDVLLATNIIEAGLDIPRANLMLVTEADRFGLAQLHQLRGRVGRGSRRGAAYLLTEPGRRLTPATRRRLDTLETLTGLGAGVAISTADIDLRGAGDLFGEAQAGQVRAMGTELYQQLLAQAVAAQRGEPPPPPVPELRAGLAGRLPEDYVPEANLRLALLRRLARCWDKAALDEFAEELEDRFGPLPPEAQPLLAAQRLRLACRAAGVVKAEAGPQACALTPDGEAGLAALARQTGGVAKDGRVLVPLGLADPQQRAAALTGLFST